MTYAFPTPEQTERVHAAVAEALDRYPEQAELLRQVESAVSRETGDGIPERALEGLLEQIAAGLPTRSSDDG